VNIPDPPHDVEMLQLLVEAGADVNKRPYIWCRIYTYDDFHLKDILVNITYKSKKKSYETMIDKEEIENIEAAKIFVVDANRVIEAFLKAGADPDKRGHPYPYTIEANRARIIDEEADEYFAKGTRPINEAIKKGIRWESHVDLLLHILHWTKIQLKRRKNQKIQP
jgi:hypothetical protein